MTNGQLGEILERMYDQGESNRVIVDSTPLHNREIKPIKAIVDGVLSRTAPPPITQPRSRRCWRSTLMASVREMTVPVGGLRRWNDRSQYR
jgi:hypothetical protein